MNGRLERMADDSEYSRPDGVLGSFEPVVEPFAAYTPPPPTVPPEVREAFGRPSGAGAYAPPAEDRLPPRHINPAVPVQAGSAETFGRTPAATDEGFDPPPGTRIAPSGRPPESPWWKADAHRDPWRDPSSPSWLGRPAIFAAGRLEQLDPEADTEQEDVPFAAVDDDEPAEKDGPQPRGAGPVRPVGPAARPGRGARRRSDRWRRRVLDL